MRKVVFTVFVTIAIAAAAQDRATVADPSGSSAPDFSSLQPLAMATREAAIYRVRAATLRRHRYSKPVAIVWTKESIVAEQKDGAATTTRKVRAGHIDVYAAETTHSLQSAKGSMHFTLIELKQVLRDPKELPSKPAGCKGAVDFPQGGFACLIELAPNQEITIPELDVNSFLIVVESGKVRYTIPRNHWESQTREGGSQYLPGYEEHRLQNLGRKPSQFVLIVPPPAEYNK